MRLFSRLLGIFDWLHAYTYYPLYPPAQEIEGIGCFGCVRSVVIPRYNSCEPVPSTDISSSTPSFHEIVLGVLEEDRGNTIPGHGGTRVYAFGRDAMRRANPVFAPRNAIVLDGLEFILTEAGGLSLQHRYLCWFGKATPPGPHSPATLRLDAQPDILPPSTTQLEMENELRVLFAHYTLDTLIPRTKGRFFFTWVGFSY